MTAKKKFVAISVVAALVVVILATSLSLFFVFGSKGPFDGTVLDETGAPVAGVSVTDGRNVVKTAADGTYTLEGYSKSRFVTVTVPSGYNCDEFYMHVDKDTSTYDFTLDTIEGVDYSDGYSYLQISDTEINYSGVGSWLDHVKKLVDEQKPAFLIHTGDICYKPGLETHLKQMNSEIMGLPVRWVIGNHDYVDEGGYGEALYESIYGPVWYSFEVGKVHYVVTPFQTGADRMSGYDKNDRWKWLENDLANVSPDMQVVMFNHNRPYSEDYVVPTGIGKKLDLKEHNLNAWIFGHYHYSYIEQNGDVLNISTARPDCGGIDSSVSGTRKITVGANGKIVDTQVYYYDFDEPLATPDAVWSNEELEGNVLFSDTLVVGDTAYVATADDDWPHRCGVYAVSTADGKTKWHYYTDNSVKNSPVYADGKILAQDAAGNVYCLDAVTGDKLWEKKVGLGNTLGTSTGIAVDGDKVFVGCAAEITALNISDGSNAWKNSVKRNKGENSPADFVIVADTLLVSSHWDALVALDKNTGKQKWSNRDDKEDESDLRFRTSTPAVIDGDTVLLASNEAIMTVRLSDGKITSRTKFLNADGDAIYTFDSSSQPLIKDGVAYIATPKKGVVAFDLASKEMLWNTVTGKSLIYTSPYSSGNAATVESSFIEKDGCLIFGASDGYLYKLGMADGNIVNKINIGAPIFGKAALDGDKVIIGDFAGRMYKLDI